MRTQSPESSPAREVLIYQAAASRRPRFTVAASAVLALLVVLAAFPVGVGVSITMESRSGGLFTTNQGERGGFAVFACLALLGSAGGWLALRQARRADAARWTRVVAVVAGVLGSVGAIIALAIFLRHGVP